MDCLIETPSPIDARKLLEDLTLSLADDYSDSIEAIRNSRNREEYDRAQFDSERLRQRLEESINVLDFLMGGAIRNVLGAERDKQSKIRLTPQGRYEEGTLK